jgi:plastocyanin
VGQSVRWTNQDGAAHTVTADDGAFDSGSLAGGKEFSFAFDRAGVDRGVQPCATSAPP